jgi:hypothetical protein
LGFPAEQDVQTVPNEDNTQVPRKDDLLPIVIEYWAMHFFLLLQRSEKESASHIAKRQRAHAVIKIQQRGRPGTEVVAKLAKIGQKMTGHEAGESPPFWRPVWLQKP